MIQYGSRTTVSQAPDGSVRAVQEKYFDWQTVKKVTYDSESVKVKNEKQALAQFLLLLDRWRNGEIQDFSINCVTDAEGQLMRVEKSWMVVDLQ